MVTIHPYLNFSGDTEEAMEFYRSIFGGEFVRLQRYKETPHSGSVPAAEQEKIMHISFPVGNVVLMATDALESMGQHLVKGNNIALSVDVESKEEADRVFRRLSEGGSVVMPLGEMFWGAYFGMCLDRYGIHWMVSFDQGR